MAFANTHPDYRILGFDPSGQLRVNFYHVADLPSRAGSFYSWTSARTSGHLAHKLETQWEQALSGAEWQTIEELELSFRAFPVVNAFGPPEAGSELMLPFSAYVEQLCDDCGGSGHDIGSLNPREFEPCPYCQGSGKETVLRKYLGEAFAIAAGQSNRPVEREHLIAMTQYARQTVSALYARIQEAA